MSNFKNHKNEEIYIRLYEEMVEKMDWTEDKYKRFEKFILGDDMDFYEEYTINLTDEEQENSLQKILILCQNIWSAVIGYIY